MNAALYGVHNHSDELLMVSERHEHDSYIRTAITAMSLYYRSV